MVTHILFDLCLFKHFSPVANFGYQSIVAGSLLFKHLVFVVLLLEKNLQVHYNANYNIAEI